MIFIYIIITIQSLGCVNNSNSNSNSRQRLGYLNGINNLLNPFEQRLLINKYNRGDTIQIVEGQMGERLVEEASVVFKANEQSNSKTHISFSHYTHIDKYIN